MDIVPLISTCDIISIKFSVRCTIFSVSTFMTVVMFSNSMSVQIAHRHARYLFRLYICFSIFYLFIFNFLILILIFYSFIFIFHFFVFILYFLIFIYLFLIFLIFIFYLLFFVFVCYILTFSLWFLLIVFVISERWRLSNSCLIHAQKFLC